MIAALAMTIVCWAPVQDHPLGEALDGDAGFGAKPDRRSIASVFRSTDAADKAFLVGLRELVVDVRTRVSVAEARARRQGAFGIVDTELDDPDTHTLAGLLARMDRIAQDPFVQDLSPEDSLAFVGALLDGRLRAHSGLLGAAEEEIDELLAALTIFHGDVHGLVDLETQEEVSAVATRADLAAARLRAVQVDLRLLAQPLHGDLPRLSSEQVRVARAIATQDLSSRRSYLALQRGAASSRRSWSEQLSLARFDLRFATELGERRSAKVASLGVAKRLPRFLPAFDGLREVPQPWADMSTTERARLAVNLGTDALRRDPLNPELNYLTARAVEFASGSKLDGPYLARFLVLRGIRHYDHRTYLERDLDERERYALDRLNTLALGACKR